MEKGDVFIISAPSGSGKTTICRMLVQRLDNVELSISYTTRLRRKGEVEGRDYYFIEREKFDIMLDSREFLEYASVYGHLYGTSREAVRSIVSRGRDVILEIDVQGGRKVKGELPEAVMIAVFPPNRRSLEQRLIGRGRDSTEEVKARLRAADGESKELLEYDYLVVNDDLEAAVNRVEWIVRAARLRRERTRNRLAKLYHETGEVNHGESDR
ncbi:MAG: guanylate kinase [Deltaproteobacteria bacterium]|jgi:guanylate kinase|nr:MAG: guanylate kinase [Deltaproteobacteria bacterium]